jgi:uncharacterized protein YfaS (alpha-2-macroglobulin family)
MRSTWPIAAVLLSAALLAPRASVAQAPDRTARAAAAREAARALIAQGNWNDAYRKLAPVVTDPADDPDQAASDLSSAVQCLRNLGRHAEFDAFVEKAIAAHPANPRLLAAAATSYQQAAKQGAIVGGAFERGPHRGGTARYVNTFQRDRVRAMQLMQQGLSRVAAASDRRFAGRYHMQLAEILMGARHGRGAWALQALTDLGRLPDPAERSGFGYSDHSPDRAAPVDEKGDPVFHALPASWEAARSDGQRWRWAMESAAASDPGLTRRVRHQYADFLHRQFGVQTVAGRGLRFGRLADGDTQAAAPGRYALRTLAEDETIARLASGVRRFKLPDDANYIRIYRELAEGNDRPAARALGQIFEDRQQYPKAAGWWNRAGNTERERQITGNWCTFEPAGAQASGQGATVDLRFRNGRKVSFTAHEIAVDKLFADIRSYLESRPASLDQDRLDIAGTWHRLVAGKQEQYLGQQVGEWQLPLDPRPDHLDRRITVTTPLSRGGAYLLRAQMEGGNTCWTVLWVCDLAIVKKPLDGKILYFVADARTGQPVANASLDFFGYRVEWKDRWVRGRQRAEVQTRSVSLATGSDGLLVADEERLPASHAWLAVAKGPGGRTGWLGWTHHGYGTRHDQEFDQTRTFFVSDRPVYRPGDTVKFKFWLNQARYDREGNSPFAGQPAVFTIGTPRGESIEAGGGQIDALGGTDGQWVIPASAPLGVYQVSIPGRASGMFRVEEYKKPEFEVTVEAPVDPVMLGEVFEARIRAKYLFGAPVKEGRVKYKVTRTGHEATWYPAAAWDWYYGRGYWWFACDYPWYPGWLDWGCRRPSPSWYGRGYGGWAPRRPPEIVAENETVIGPDGTVKVAIDTALAQATQGSTDHRYEITAEVTDRSRRTITGSGAVLVARRPFKVYAWLDRGHYRVGDAIEASFHAQTLDAKPVRGAGELKLFRLSFGKDGKPVETPVQSWPLATGPEGHARHQMKASEPGQYRLSYTVTDARGRAIEGGYVFVIAGAGSDGSDFRFNDLELVADRKEYRPGEQVQLRVNAERRDATVLLFVRAASGLCQPPTALRLQGKTALVPVDVTKKDMPNFFIEALTVSSGRVHQQTLEIVVPPQDRILQVRVQPASEKVKPGQKTSVSIQLTEANGEPYVGSLVVSMYDKAVEYIAGGAGVPDIREVFWKWRRHHHPQRETNLDLASRSMTRPGESGMGALGVFGHEVAHEDEADGGGGGGGGILVPRTRLKRMKSAGAKADGAEDLADEHGAGMRRFAPEPGVRGVAPIEMAALRSPRARNREAQARDSDDALASASPPPEALVQPSVRRSFADTAFWAASLTTDRSGRATIEVPMPENLTTWQTKVWAMGGGARVGQGEAQVVTTKNLVLRLQAPRFLVETDEVVLSANVHNYLSSQKSVKAMLELDGGTCAPVDGTATTRTVAVDAGGEARVDWRVKVLKEGKAIVRMKALSDEESDAMQMELPVLVHGMLKTESFCGVIRLEGSAARLDVEVPARRKPDQSRLEIRYSPTLAMAMVDALPYLVEYPYGCTEQTLNRFLPAVLTQKALIRMGVSLKDVADKITNLNAQEVGDDVKRSTDWKRLSGTMRWDGRDWAPRNPVFDEREVRSMIRAGLERLAGMQCGDGGWGWFSGDGERSAPHTTALVVHGLQIARFDDAAIPAGMLERGVRWLKGYQAGELSRLDLPGSDPKRKVHADALDAFVSMVLADAKADDARMRDRIYQDRNHLAVYAKSMLGLALHRAGENEKRDVVIRNIEQYLVTDEENHTAHLKLPEGDWWWCWYGSELEAQAYYLKLLAAAQPTSEKAPRLVKYLLNNRRHSTYWSSTRDTAIVVEAFADYVAASGEDRPDLSVEVLVDGKSARTVKISPDNLFAFDNKLVLAGAAVATGRHTLEIRKTGKGPLYWNVYLTCFTQEDRIGRAGLELKVDRTCYRLVREARTVQAPGDRGQVLDRKVENYRREKLEDLSTLRSGELVEVELVIESKNDYEYIVIEDAKAAGFEPVDVRSGYNGNEMGAYVELRDTRVTFFVPSLARGRHSVSYRVRAETPGRYSALPARAQAMYAPELAANSDEIKLAIQD